MNQKRSVRYLSLLWFLLPVLFYLLIPWQRISAGAGNGTQITVQRYAWTKSLDLSNTSGNGYDLPVLDLSGTSDTASAILKNDTDAMNAITKYLSVSTSGEDRNKIRMIRSLTPLYKDQKYPVVSMSDIPDLSDNGHYRLSELWVLRDGHDPLSMDEKDWIVYTTAKLIGAGLSGFDELELKYGKQPLGFAVCSCGYAMEFYTEGMSDEEHDVFDQHHYEHALNGEASSFHTTAYKGFPVYVTEDTVFRFVYEETTGSGSAPVAFYDYDITDGYLYTDSALTRQKDVSEQSRLERTQDIYVRTNAGDGTGYGINSAENYESNDLPKLAFGNSNTNTGMGSYTLDGLYINQYNRSVGQTFKGAHFGLVTGLDKDGHLIWDDRLDVPDLFSEGPAAGKTEINDLFLDFSREGDSYTLQAVTGTTADHLDRFNHPSYERDDGTSAYHDHIWTNNFWPVDSADTFGADGHDLKFGQDTDTTLKSRRHISPGAVFAASDDGMDHNSYFGMHFETEFSIPEGYAGNLEYCFFGDDDLFVFLCDEDYSNAKLILDTGGVHTSIGEYVNLWDHLDKDRANGKTYKLVVYFMERGASGSVCWIHFTLPNATFKEVERLSSTDLTIRKVWEDGNDADDLRPDTVSVDLLRNGALMDTLTLSETDGWELEVTDLPVHDENGNEYVYTVRENNVPEGYEASTDGYTITNRHTPSKTTSITVRKVWEDGNNADDLRPDTVSVDLLRNGALMDTLTLSETDGWELEVTDLPVHDENGNEYVYTVRENNVPEGYEASVNGYTITNRHTPSKTTSITVRKVWEDGNNADDLRPDTVSVDLLRNGALMDTLTLSETDGWELEVTDLPVHDENGNEYVYTVRENNVPEGYEASVNGYTITNRHTPSKTTSITVRKVWEDGNNADDLRPDTVSVDLLRNGALMDTLTLSETDGWELEVTDLPVHDENGNEYVYTVRENNVPEGYEASVNGYTITNRHTPSKTTSITVRKVWEDGNDADDLRPDTVSVDLLRNGALMDTLTLSETDGWELEVTDLPVHDENGNEYVYTVRENNVPEGYEASTDGYTITNRHTPSKTTSITVRKVWEDGNNADDLRPDTVSVDLLRDGALMDTLTLSETDGWELEVTDLPVHDENGNEYVYTVRENNVPEGYEASTDGYTITNRHMPSRTTSITVRKVWEDGNDADDLRPDTISVDLLRNGAVMDTLTLSETDGWELEVTDLPVHDENGNEYVYTVRENNVPEGYEASTDGYTITNRHMPSRTTSITVRKVWEDGNDADDLRPDTISVDLLRNGAVMDTLTLSETDGWELEVTDLPVHDENGNEYVYTVRENNVPEGYEASTDGYTITNRHMPSRTTSITVRKVWEDGNDADDLRPDTISVDLLRNGAVMDTLTLSETDGWELEVTDLPVHDENGNEYVYTVRENNVPEGYEASTDGYTITNRHMPSRTTSITVRKVWEDGNDADDLRPDTISVDLLRNGAVMDTLTLSETDGWELEVTDLPVHDENGNEYVYTVRENNVPEGYEASTDGYTITNRHTPSKTTSITVRKVWEDGNDADDLRPDTISVDLLRNGAVMDTLTLSETDGWELKVTDLPVHDENGNEYVYTVRENNVPEGYEASTDGYTITNRHTPSKTTAITIRKVWEDEDNRCGKRPDSIAVELLQNGTRYKTCSLDADSDWQHTFTDLPKTDVDGNAYTYTVNEPDIPEGYLVKINGYTITNICNIPTLPVDPDDNKPDDKPDDSSDPDDNKPDDSLDPDDNKPDDSSDPDDNKPDDKPDDSSDPDDSKPDDNKPDNSSDPDDNKPDNKPDDNKPDDSSDPDDNKPDDKPDNNKPDDFSDPDDNKPDDKPDNNKPDDFSDPDDNKPDDKPDNNKPDDFSGSDNSLTGKKPSETGYVSEKNSSSGSSAGTSDTASGSRSDQMHRQSQISERTETPDTGNVPETVKTGQNLYILIGISGLVLLSGCGYVLFRKNRTRNRSEN